MHKPFATPFIHRRRLPGALYGICLLGAWALHPLPASAAPANDSFSLAEPLTLGLTVAGTTLDATRETGDPEPAAHSRSVWYSFTPTNSQLVSLSGTTSDDPLAAYLVSGNSLLSSALLDDAVFTSRPLSFYAVAGHTYRICVDDYVPGYINYHGYPFTLGLAGGAALPAETRFVEPLSNDNFDQATALTGSSASLVLNSSAATFEPFEQAMLAEFTPPPPYSRTGPGGIWVSWTAPASGKTTVTAQTPANSKVLMVLGQGGSIAGLTLLQGAYNGFIFSAQSGATYKIYLLSQVNGQVLFRLTSEGTASGGGGITAPAVAHPGTYTGLQDDVSLSVTLAASKAFTGRLVKGGVAYVLKGALNSTGSYTGTLGQAGTPFGLTAAGGATGLAIDDTIAFTVDGRTLTARPRAYAATEIPPTLGNYTVLLKASDAGATIPQGTGYARLSIARGGAVRMLGKLADGSAFSSAGVLRAGADVHPQWDLYNSALYARLGLLAGTFTLPTSAGAELTGMLAWRKLFTGRGAYYPAGFTSHLSVAGFRYVAPARGTLALPLADSLNNIALTLAGGALASPFEETGTLTSANQVLIGTGNVEKMKVAINASTGLLVGSFIHPLTQKAVIFSGVLYQGSTGPGAYGWFLGPVSNGVGESGLFSLTAP